METLVPLLVAMKDHFKKAKDTGTSPKQNLTFTGGTKTLQNRNSNFQDQHSMQ